MRLFVFALEVEDVNAKADVVEVWVQLDVLSKHTVVIEKDMVRFDHFHLKRALEEFLQRCILSAGLRDPGRNIFTATLATPSAPNMVSWPSIIPHGATASCSLWVRDQVNFACSFFWVVVG